jgi:hypothetical protein
MWYKKHKTARYDSFSVIGKNKQNTQVADEYILGRSDSEVQEAGINKKPTLKLHDIKLLLL